MNEKDNIIPIWKKLESLLNNLENKQESPGLTVETMIRIFINIEEISLELSMSKGKVSLDQAVIISRYIRSRLGLPENPAQHQVN